MTFNYNILTEMGYIVKEISVGINFKKLEIMLNILEKNTKWVFICREIEFIEIYLQRPLCGTDFIIFNKDNYIYGNFSRDFNRKFLEKNWIQIAPVKSAMK